MDYALGEDQIRHFNENGYVTEIRLLSEEQVEVLKGSLQSILQLRPEEQELFYEYNSNESEDPSRVLFHALGAWRVSEPFHDVLWNPAFLMASYQLLGKPVVQFHDQLFCKPSKHGGVVAWHQDYSYWTWTRPMNHLTCWIALDDADENNGCLYYVPGSHRWGLLPRTGLAGDMESVGEVLTADQKQAMAQKVSNPLKSGYASFHHPLMMHGSYENRSDRERRALVLNVMGEGTRSNVDIFENKEDTGNFPIPPQDKPMAGKFYPVLFDPEKELSNLKEQVPTIAALT